MVQTSKTTAVAKRGNNLPEKKETKQENEMMDMDEMISYLEEIDDDAFESAAYPILEMEPGVVEKCFYIGMTTFNGEQGTTQAAILLCQDGVKRILPNAMPVDILKSYEPPMPVILTVTGEKKGKAGRVYKTFDVQKPKGVEIKSIIEE